MERPGLKSLTWCETQEEQARARWKENRQADEDDLAAAFKNLGKSVLVCTFVLHTDTSLRHQSVNHSATPNHKVKQNQHIKADESCPYLEPRRQDSNHLAHEQALAHK